MQIEVLQTKILETPADGLIVGVSTALLDEQGLLPRLNDALRGVIGEEIKGRRLTGKLGDVRIVHTLGLLPVRAVILVGIGERGELNAHKLKETWAKALNKARHEGLAELLVCFGSFRADGVDARKLGETFALSAHLSQYRFQDYKTKREEADERTITRLALGIPPELKEDVLYGLETGTHIADGVNLARTLVSTPANKLTPEVFSARVVEVAKRYDLSYEVLEKRDMEELGMGALLAVAQGSANPPKLVTVRYKGRPTWESEPVVAFVGKGITFDTGGISLKPSLNMEEMIMDMGGAAAVAGAMEAIARIRPEINILFVMPMVENMPDGAAYRPGDVLTSMSGKTIEVISTDAEGRLILADAITYVRRLGATHLVDLATLTGAVLIALGTQTTGAMTNNDDWWQAVRKAAEEAGERIWLLPTFDVYREQYKSAVADMKNTGGRNAGTITAGMFLSEFAEQTPWVHLDIAGTAWDSKGSDLTPKGATGVMVQTLVELARQEAKKKSTV
ncbi:MAG: Cytosol aminopeptidase PepA [Candidatus Carbobacillus altaicus]|uniref:Probable cytosol aminopeptidase n=1 Tax=Candidatus Carbonibacillus altaicus TaxID=2163959 RepID=A0A2R6Y2E5_9BACL|nr:MAG: Cytosol aminopeptidase PepA [Candidatus Carbobacillus altaicus]